MYYITYAKQDTQDIFIKIDITNRGKTAANYGVANSMVLQPLEYDGIDKRTCYYICK